ncbi:hypothetical protein HOT99_gp249 [Caulobacter phage CcrBL10]|uniref:Uncharacterized protein n=1 Tax=Caulobacter phage CcrBL10 TaxID=2283269 RepID=A0A385ECA7_9CAUD|nr:hypothetical protein HOT99_gp249 [Caulobacter phage CcrBL10]AXQ68368.1 hypothetical protein CcrBL10_gp164c [Caulobacter phage CcrBL10]
MQDIYFILGGLIALARIGYRYAIDYPQVRENRENRFNDDWKIGFFFMTLGQAAILWFCWLGALVAYGFYLLFKRYAKKD